VKLRVEMALKAVRIEPERDAYDSGANGDQKAIRKGVAERR
jgi:hypothetical protein